MSQLKNMSAMLEKAQSVKDVFTLDFVAERTTKNYQLATGRKDASNWFQREVMAMVAIFGEKPALANTDRMSIWGCLMTAARKGLSIADGEMDLIPYGKILKAEPNYKGLRKQLRLMPEIKFVHEAQVVFKGEVFEHDRLNNKILKHEAKTPPRTITLDIIEAAYVRVEFTDGHTVDVVMNHAGLLSAFNRSPNKEGPWKTNTEEMCKKSVIKRANKAYFQGTDYQIGDDEFKQFEVKDDEPLDVAHTEVQPEAQAEVVSQPAPTPPPPAEEAKVVPPRSNMRSILED